MAALFELQYVAAIIHPISHISHTNHRHPHRRRAAQQRILAQRARTQVHPHNHRRQLHHQHRHHHRRRRLPNRRCCTIISIRVMDTCMPKRQCRHRITARIVYPRPRQHPQS